MENLVRGLVFGVVSFLLTAPIAEASTKTYGQDIYPTYSNTFGYYKTSSGRYRYFPVLSQFEQGREFSESGYRYVPDGRRGKTVKTNLSLACGPIALLMLKSGVDRKSYFHLHANKHNDNLRDKVAELRSSAGIRGNTSTRVLQLRTMANSLGFSYAESEEHTTLHHERTFNNGVEFIDTNLNHRINAFEAMKSEIKRFKKIIFLAKPNSRINTANSDIYSHFMLIYRIKEYDKKISYGDKLIKKGYIYLLDPWTGSRRMVSKKDFLDSIDLSNNVNDYLVIK